MIYKSDVLSSISRSHGGSRELRPESCPLTSIHNHGTNEGQEDGSVGKMTVLQVQDPELEAQNPCKNAKSRGKSL